MKIHEFIEANPQPEGMNKREYFRRLAKMYNEIYNANTGAMYIRKVYYEQRKLSASRMTTTKQTYDKHGNIVSTTKSLRPLGGQSVEGLKVLKITQNPYGGEWVTYSNEDQETDYEALIDKAVKKYFSGKAKKFSRKRKYQKKALIGIISDAHIGMSVEDDLFDYKWDCKEFNKRLDVFFQSLMAEYENNGRFEKLILLDLGDGLDGYNKYTTRGGHELPQNLSNSEAFNCFVDGKIKLVESILDADIADKIEMQNVCNDNHAGDFAEIANLTIKKIFERITTRIEVTNLVNFFESCTYGQHTFIMTHGKDKKFMSRGLPLALNDRAENLINKFISHHDLKGNIHVMKGDLHQLGYSRCKAFDYYNFMSFAPASAWVQHNFGPGYNGFSLMIVPADSDQVTLKHHFF